MEKTQYFTTENIGKKAADILNELRGKVQIHEDTLNIDKSALFILDMQEFFFNKNSHAYMPSGKAIINGIAKFSKIFDNKNRPIIVTKHINTNENAKMMDYWWRDILTMIVGSVI